MVNDFIVYVMVETELLGAIGCLMNKQNIYRILLDKKLLRETVKPPSTKP